MRSLSAFIFSTVAMAIVWALSSVVLFSLLGNPALEFVHSPDPTEMALLAAGYGGGGLLWYFVSCEMAAMIGRRAAINWTLIQTSILLIALPFIGSSFSMLLMIVTGLGFMGAVVWSVWFPMIMEVDHRVRPTAVAAFFVSLYVVAGIAIPSASELVLRQGTTHALLILGGTASVATLVCIFVSKKMLRPTRTIAPVSFLRLSGEDIRDLLNMSFIFLFLLGLLTLPLVLQTTDYLLVETVKQNLRFETQSFAWIMAFGRVPALAVLLVAMPAMKNTVPIRFFGVGLVVAAIGLAVAGTAQEIMIFVVGYLACFAGIGLCWSSFYGSVVAAVIRDIRAPGFLLAGLGLVLGSIAAGGLHYGLLLIDLQLDHIFLACAATVCGSGVLLVMGSLIGSLNGAYEGGHFDDEQTPHQAGFRKFKYGNPRL